MANPKLKRKRQIAKVGMAGSMATALVSGFMHKRYRRTIHTWTGLALVGFSLWHWKLYQPRHKKKQLEKRA